MLLKLSVDGASNAVTASHRFLESNSFRHWQATGRQRFREFSTPLPRSDVGGRLREAGAMALGVLGIGESTTDNGSVNVVKMVSFYALDAPGWPKGSRQRRRLRLLVVARHYSYAGWRGPRPSPSIPQALTSSRPAAQSAGALLL